MKSTFSPKNLLKITPKFHELVHLHCIQFMRKNISKILGLSHIFCTSYKLIDLQEALSIGFWFSKSQEFGNRGASLSLYSQSFLQMIPNPHLFSILVTLSYPTCADITYHFSINSFNTVPFHDAAPFQMRKSKPKQTPNHFHYFFGCGIALITLCFWLSISLFAITIIHIIVHY